MRFTRIIPLVGLTFLLGACEQQSTPTEPDPSHRGLETPPSGDGIAPITPATRPAGIDLRTRAVIASLIQDFEGQRPSGEPSAVSPPGDPAFFPRPEVATGHGFSCALRLRFAYCWGTNMFGQLGDGTLEDNPLPAPVQQRRPFLSITAGNYHACGLAPDGSAWCWGGNGSGQLGVPTESEGGLAFSPTPVPVSGGLSFASLNAGLIQTCGITREGRTYCWGYNGRGALGDGTFESSSSPVAVVGDLDFASL
jgi:hypothetical protein